MFVHEGTYIATPPAYDNAVGMYRIPDIVGKLVNPKTRPVIHSMRVASGPPNYPFGAYTSLGLQNLFKIDETTRVWVCTSRCLYPTEIARIEVDDLKVGDILHYFKQNPSMYLSHAENVHWIVLQTEGEPYTVTASYARTVNGPSAFWPCNLPEEWPPIFESA